MTANSLAARPRAASSLGLALSIFLPFAAAYYLSFLYRTITAVIAPDLVADVGLAASDLGLLSSVYFLSFALLQLPMGMLLDRYGPRKVNAGLLLFAAAGALLFALARGLPGLALGRALIGMGVSCCMMASFKAFALWFPPRRLPALNGCLLAVGALGALSATAPTEWLLGFTDWRGLFLGLAVATAAAMLAVFLVVPEHGEAPAHSGLRQQMAGLAQVYRDPLFWRIAPVTALSGGASLAVIGLWGGPWLRDVGGLGRGEVAYYLLLIAVGMGAGYLTLGLLTERLGRLGIRPLWISGTGMSVFLLAMAALASGHVAPSTPLFLLFGFAATSQTLNYSLLAQHFGPQLTGRASTALNLLLFVAAFLLQWGCGVVLGYWPSPSAEGYAVPGYQLAFGALAALQALGLIWFFSAARRR